jgi:putative transposase
VSPSLGSASAGIQEAWVRGLFIRQVDELVQAVGLSGIGKNNVIELSKDVDERVVTFLNRNLASDMRHLRLEAAYLKQREA